MSHVFTIDNLLVHHLIINIRGSFSQAWSFPKGEMHFHHAFVTIAVTFNFTCMAAAPLAFTGQDQHHLPFR